MQTSTNYVAAYLKEKARANELRDMLTEQIKNTSRALNEAEKLRGELKEVHALYHDIRVRLQHDTAAE